MGGIEALIKKFIYKLGVQLRNKKIFANYKFLKESENWSIDQLEDYQLRKLKEIVNYAYYNSSFYRELFDQEGLKPNIIKKLEDLNKLPIIEKHYLKLKKDLNNVKTKEKTFYSETSGSTGEPLIFYRNKTWDAWHRASIYRGYSWHGVKPYEKNGYLWGFNFNNKLKTKILDVLQNRFRLFSYNEKDLKKFIKKLNKAVYLKGYSSMIYYISKYINEFELPINNLKLVIGTSEKIYEHYNKEAKKAFGRKIISEYGAAETGLIAFECEEGNMHLNMETCIVEEINNEIIITNLFSHSFPIIRYKLGDYIEIDKNKKCECGRNHYILKEVKGRVGKNIYGKQQQYPSLTIYYIFKNLAKELNIGIDYQVIQREKGKIEIYLYSKKNEITIKYLCKEIYKYFSKDIDFEIYFKENIKLQRDSKFKDFISLIEEEK